MQLETLSKDALASESQKILYDVQTSLNFSYYSNPYNDTSNFTGNTADKQLELQLNLLLDPEYDRSISFYNDPNKDKTFGGDASGFAIFVGKKTYIFISDSYANTFLILIENGRVVKNYKFEQQIYSGPEMITLARQLEAHPLEK